LALVSTSSFGLVPYGLGSTRILAPNFSRFFERSQPMTMKSEIIDWYSSKRERGRNAIEMLYNRRRPSDHYLRRMQEQKAIIRDNICIISRDIWGRQNLFNWFQILKYGRYHDRLRAKRILHIIRSHRFNFGNPPSLRNSTLPFWTDPQSRFFNQFDLEKAQKTMPFETFTIKIADKEYFLVLNTEQSRAHHDCWTVEERDLMVNEEREIREINQTFYFASYVDLIEFRMRYEFEQV
jgi:hypothetical protein